MNVAVIGGTGKLGFPVALALQSSGMDVSIFTRDAQKSATEFGGRFKYVECDVLSPESVEKQLVGYDAVHINLAGVSKQQCLETVAGGTRNIVSASKKNGVGLISFISGCTVSPENIGFYDIQAKYEAEQAIKNSGIPYLIFCPTWFMESLPQFVQEKRASVFGLATQPIHWVAVADYAQQVAKAYMDTDIRNKRLFIHGPEAIPLKDALAQYLKIGDIPLNVTHTPYWMATVLKWVTGDPSIRYAADLSQYFETVGEQGDPREAHGLLGKPSMTLEMWCENHFSERKIAVAS